MPFEISPKFIETETKPARFQKFADAMLRGCAIRPVQCREAWMLGADQACALGALGAGMGLKDGYDVMKLVSEDDDVRDMRDAYDRRYQTSIEADNDRGTFTREQIAARIAAL